MEVIKRDGSRESVSFDKITERIKKQSSGLKVNSTALAQKVVAQLYNGVHTSELDELTAQIAANLSTSNPDYGILASRITISNHQKNTDPSFSATMRALASQVAPNGEPFSYISDEILSIVDAHGDRIDAMIDHDRDFLIDYFGFQTLYRAYLLKDRHGRVLERPQYMWMRVALALWSSADSANSFDRVVETYTMLSTKRFTHATPTLFNAGTPRQQLSSCFLLGISDSISGIYKSLADCASISKYAGGIGMHCSNIRAKGSIIRGTNGKSNGLVPMLRVFNNTARYVDQCFVADTYVHTKTEDGLAAKKICLFKKDDLVLGSDGRYQKVTKLLNHSYDGPLCVVKCAGQVEQSIQVTPEHPLLSVRAGDFKSWSEIRDRLSHGQIQISYNAVGELMPGDYVASPGELKITNAEYWGGFYFRRISSIDRIPFSGALYDMEVEGTHDYTIVGLGVAHNGGGKRNGSFAIYLEPWHADVEDFLRLKLNGGAEEERARDLFYALWIPDLFMRRVEEGGSWTLFCPDEAPGLADCYGAEFDQLYERYEREGKGKKTIEAQKLWFQILDTQIETGTPYLCYKDAANSKSNQQNLGVIKSSNLCVAPETLVLTDQGEFPIVELEGKTVNVWNGNQWSATTVVKTGTDQSIIGVDILDATMDDNGVYSFVLKHLECTPYHKFLLEDDDDASISEAKRVSAMSLERGMNLRPWIDPSGQTHEAIVWSVLDYCRTVDTYCFNEPLNHAGVFNGILTGNCSEIIEYTSPEETAVCNLASMALPSYVDKATRTFDYDGFRAAVAVAVRNLNRVIDINYYPTPETRTSNMRHRPIGLGVQGLADVFALMRLAWESPEAARTNQLIFEHMYYAAVEASHEEALKTQSYSSFQGSPASQGRLQPDLWGVTPITEQEGSLDWPALRRKASQALANSLLIAPMPTASTSQILASNECIEPVTSNIYTRRTIAGEFILVNKYLVAELADRGLWSEDMKQVIIAYNGSIQEIEAIPADIRERYKTSWEIKQRTLIDMAAARGAFVCQSQSLNLFVADPNYSKLTSMHFHAWRKGLKTGIYYLRTKAGVQAQKFTVDPTLLAKVGKMKAKESRAELLERLAREFEEEKQKASEEGCLMCSG